MKLPPALPEKPCPLLQIATIFGEWSRSSKSIVPPAVNLPALISPLS